MMLPIVDVLLLSFIGSIAGLIGGVVFLIKKNWAESLCNYAVPFAAGVLISVSLVHLLPEAVEQAGERVYAYVLLAILVSFFFEQFLANLHHHSHMQKTKIQLSVPLVLIGDTIHNFIDGLTIAAAYITEPAFGFVVALATFLHETPHEISDFGVLISAGWTRKKTFMANFLSSIATFPGALLVFYFMRDAGQIIGLLLAVSAGVFLYLGASDFLPQVAEEGKGISAISKFLFILLGAGIMVVLRFIGI